MLKAKAIAFPFKLDFLNTFFVTCTNHLKGVFVRKLQFSSFSVPPPKS